MLFRSCQELVLTEGFSLADLPVLQCWPDDGGRFITLPLVFSRDPDTGKRNCGMYRMQLHDATTTGMHWQIHKGGAHHYRTCLRDGRRLEVAVAIGADPVVTFAATLPLPEDFDEMIFAGFLRGGPVEMVPCRTVDLEVPATAEIVLEGYVQPGELRREGPFGDHTGFYSLADDYPVFHVQCVTRKRQPIYHTTIFHFKWPSGVCLWSPTAVNNCVGDQGSIRSTGTRHCTHRKWVHVKHVSDDFNCWRLHSIIL